MENEDHVLGDVVVTALGLTVDKDKVSGTITSVSSELMKTTGESGVIQSLSAKTSGINIVKSTGDPGAGAYIQIRGQNTITGSTQPLIIIDGVPIINSSRGGGTAGVVQQSRLNDINPADIATVDILKGASAAAVWGTRAANGVIVITTKSGKGKKKGVSVEFNAGMTYDQISIEHQKQDLYGQGRYGAFEAERGESWGDKIADRAGGADEVDETGGYFEAEDGTKYYPVITKNSTDTFNDANRDQVFRNGMANDLGLSLTLNGDNSNTYLSVSDWNQKGIINGVSDYRRSTVRVNFKSTPTNNVRFRVNSAYSRISSNRVQSGSNLNGLYLGYLRTSPDFDNTDYKGTYYDASGNPNLNAHRSYRRFLGDRAPTYNNPGWTINEQINTSEVHRMMISPELQVDLISGTDLQSSITARFGNDVSVDKRNTFFPVNSAADFSSGYFDEEWLVESEHSFEAFTRTLHTFDNMNLSWVLGTQYSTRLYNYHSSWMTSFINESDQIFDYANATVDNRNASKYESVKNSAAGYLVVNVDLFDQVFVEVTGRTEKSNAFSSMLFYPSVSAAWQLTKTVIPTSNVLSFAKLRASYGTVGIEPPLYIGGTDYIGGSVGSGWGAVLSASRYGGGLQRSTVQGNENIVPERKTEMELGTDIRLLNDALSLSATLYQNRTVGAIFAVDVPASTGFSSTLDNAATLSNTGVEIDLTGSIVKTDDLNVDILVNFTKNKNIVEDLKGVESIFLNGFTGTSSRAVEGEPLGTLWGGKWDRDENDNMILDSGGFPTVALGEGIIGDPNPDFKAGLGTKIGFKGLSVNVLFDHSHGGDMWAGTYGVLNHFGIAPVTANEVTPSADLTAYNGAVHTAGTAVRGNIHDFGGGDVLLDQSWYSSTGGGFGAVGEQFIFDASYTRLREISLAYQLPSSILEKAKIASLGLSLTGRNLALWSEFADKYGVDPETNLTGVSNGRGLDYFTNPSTKSYVVKLTIGF